MKKLLALLLALVMILSLVACAEEEEDSIRRDRKNKEQTTEGTEEETEPEETEEETEEVTEEETEPEETEDAPFGTVDGQVYENAYMGFGVKLDRNWVIATAEEAAEVVGMGAQFMGVDEQLSQGTYCDLYAMTADNTALNIMLQKESLYTKIYKDEQILEVSAEIIVSQFESIGMSDVQVELTTATFAGRQCAAMGISGSMSGITLVETMILWREGDYMATITVGGRDAAACGETMELFYALD